MNDDVRKQQVLDLTTEIAKMTDDGIARNARDIMVAARTISQLVSPSALDGVAKLVVRMAPHVPQADRVELADGGGQVQGVRAIEVIDQHGEQRVVKLTIAGVTVLGQPEVNGA